MPAGVDSQGFTKKTLEDIKNDLEEDQLANIDPALVLASNQFLGQINASVSKKAAELWELAEVAYNGFDRASAEGRQLDNLGSLTGTGRGGARKTLVVCTLGLDASKSYTPDQLMANVANQPDLKFTNRDAVTSTTAGAYSGIVFEAIATGPSTVNAGTLTAITNSVTGWNTITNPEDGVSGANVEEDGDYRISQDEELAAPGSNTVDGIRVDVLRVKGIEQCTCFENVTMFTDDNDLPAKSIEVVIFDGIIPSADDDEIAQAIWDSKPPGGETVGTSFGTAIDDTGRSRIVNFSRATIRNVYLEYDVTVDAKKFPTDGVGRIKQAAVNYGDNRNQDDDVIALALRACVLDPVVKGVTDVAALRLGFSSSPTGTTNLVISIRERADFDTSRIVVNLV